MIPHPMQFDISFSVNEIRLDEKVTGTLCSKVVYDDETIIAPYCPGDPSSESASRPFLKDGNPEERRPTPHSLIKNRCDFAHPHSQKQCEVSARHVGARVRFGA